MKDTKEEKCLEITQFVRQEGSELVRTVDAPLDHATSFTWGQPRRN